MIAKTGRLRLLLASVILVFISSGTSFANDTSLARLEKAIVEDNEAIWEAAVKNDPSLLRQENERGQTMAEVAILHYDSEGKPLTNYFFVRFLMDNDFFGMHPHDEREILRITTAISTQNRFIKKDLSGRLDPYLYGKLDPQFREKLIELLTGFTKYEGTLNAIEDDGFFLKLLISVCEKYAFKPDDIHRSKGALNSLFKGKLTETHIKYAAVYVHTNTMDENCARALIQ